MFVPTGGKTSTRTCRATKTRSPIASKMYFPRNPLEVVLVMQEARALGQGLSICGQGDELGERDEAVLSLAQLDRILAFDRDAKTVTVEPGVSVRALEAFLAREGFGLKVTCGDPGRVVGSVAATLGVGPSSHRYGLFTDQVVAVTQVSRDGSSRRFLRAQEGRAGIVRRLTMGQDVTVNLTLDVIDRDKRQVLVRQHVRRFSRLDDFAAAASEHARTERGAMLKFARMVDLTPGAGASVCGAVVSVYEVSARLEKASRVFARGQAALRRRTPSFARQKTRAVRSAMSLCGPRYVSFAEAEGQVCRVRTIDDGARSYRVLVAESQCEPVIHAIHQVCTRAWRAGLIEGLAVTVSAVRSASLSRCGDSHCELRLDVRSGPRAGDQGGLSELDEAMGALCLHWKARRLALPSWRADVRLRQ